MAFAIDLPAIFSVSLAQRLHESEACVERNFIGVVLERSSLAFHRAFLSGESRKGFRLLLP